MDSAWKKLARYGYAIGDTIEDAAKGVIEGVTDAAEGVVEGVTGAASATIDAGELDTIQSIVNLSLPLFHR